jgi:hypothetical protein
MRDDSREGGGGRGAGAEGEALVGATRDGAGREIRATRDGAGREVVADDEVMEGTRGEDSVSESESELGGSSGSVTAEWGLGEPGPSPRMEDRAGSTLSSWSRTYEA